MRKIYAIVADVVTKTPKISFKFMFESKAPYPKFADLAEHFGFLTLETKTDDHIDIFRLARREPGAIGDDGTPRWTLIVCKSGQGQIISGGVDQDQENKGLKDLLKELPDCVLLTHKEALESLTSVCQQLDIELKGFIFSGTLSTS